MRACVQYTPRLPSLSPQRAPISGPQPSLEAAEPIEGRKWVPLVPGVVPLAPRVVPLAPRVVTPSTLCTTPSTLCSTITWIHVGATQCTHKHTTPAAARRPRRRQRCPRRPTSVRFLPRPRRSLIGGEPRVRDTKARDCEGPIPVQLRSLPLASSLGQSLLLASSLGQPLPLAPSLGQLQH